MGVTSTVGQGVVESKEVFRCGGVVVEESLEMLFFPGAQDGVRIIMDGGTVQVLKVCHR